jgi:hypothetical protein
MAQIVYLFLGLKYLVFVAIFHSEAQYEHYERYERFMSIL